MREKLVIFIHSHDVNHPSWVMLNAESHVQQHKQNSNPDELASLAENKEVIVIVPAEDILLTLITLPKMNRSKLLQALPFALEDQLISDVETLHFVAGDIQLDGSTPAAVIAKEKIQTWIDLLKSWHIQADIMMPLTFALPVAENTWHVEVNEIVNVRLGNYLGFSGDKNNINELITIALDNASHLPQLIYFHHCTSDALNLQLNPEISIKDDYTSEEKLTIEMAKSATNLPYLNLLTGIYKNKKTKFPERRKLLNVAMGLTATWLFLLFLYPTISYFILNQTVNDMNAKIKKIYMYHFPNSTSMVAPKLRMEEKLRKAGSLMNENKFFVLLNLLGQDMKDQLDIKLKRLDFQNNQMSLELTAASSETLANFMDFLTQQGLQVKQQNANLIGENINATIVLQ